MLRRLPPPGEQSIRAALVAAQRDYLRRGVCTAQDGAASAQLLGVYKMLVREKLLRLRLAAYFEPQSYEKAAREMPQAVGRYDSNFKIAGIKIFLDGSPQAKTAWMLEPYIGGGFGAQTMSDSQVEDAMELSVRNKTQLIAHCNGDAAAQQFLRCAEKVAGRYPEFCSLRPVIIHAQFITEEQVARAGRLGFCEGIAKPLAARSRRAGGRNKGAFSPPPLSPGVSPPSVALPRTLAEKTPWPPSLGASAANPKWIGRQRAGLRPPPLGKAPSFWSFKSPKSFTSFRRKRTRTTRRTKRTRRTASADQPPPLGASAADARWIGG